MDEIVKGVRMMDKLGMIEDYLKLDKVKELLGVPTKKKKSPLVAIFAIVGGLVVIAGIGYCVYRYFFAEPFEDFDEEYEDYDEDYFEDESETI